MSIKTIWLLLARVILACPGWIRRPAAFGMARFLVNRYARLTIQGRDNLPPDRSQPCIFIANHLSNADGMILGIVLREYSPYFLAGVKLNREVNSRLMLEAFNIVPVQPDTADHQAIQSALELSKRGHSLMVFPEGTRSRTAALQEGKRGIVLLAKLAGVPILPLGLEGTEKLCPINEAGIGEEFFQPAAVRVKIGKALTLPPIREGEKKREWEERVLGYLMDSIAGLLSASYQGRYGQGIPNKQGGL